VILEVGAERGEGSSAFLARVAHHWGIRFVNVDPDITTHATVIGFAEVVPLPDHVRFAYLDGHDWPYSWHLSNPNIIGKLIMQYAERGQELTREASASSHLKIVQRLLPHFTDRSTVVLDDTWRRGKIWSGKGTLAMPFLLDHGWNLIVTTDAEEPDDGFTLLERR
jgi:hypothetical protein